MGLWLKSFSLKDYRNLGLRSGLRFQKRSYEIVLPLGFGFKYEWLASRTLGGFNRSRRLGFGMPAAHYAFIEALLDHFARGGLQNHLVAQHCRAIGLFIEVGLDAVGFLGGQKARIQPRVRQFQALSAVDHVLNRDVPFMSQCFYAFTRHP